MGKNIIIHTETALISSKRLREKQQNASARRNWLELHRSSAPFSRQKRWLVVPSFDVTILTRRFSLSCPCSLPLKWMLFFCCPPVCLFASIKARPKTRGTHFVHYRKGHLQQGIQCISAFERHNWSTNVPAPTLESLPIGLPALGIESDSDKVHWQAQRLAKSCWSKLDGSGDLWERC